MTRRLTIIGVAVTLVLAACGTSSSKRGGLGALTTTTKGDRGATTTNPTTTTGGGGGSSGGDASTPEGQAYVDAMMRSKNSNDLAKDLTDAQARCLAEGLVNAVGVDTLKSNGVTPSDLASGDNGDKLKGKLSTDQANKLADLILGNKCFDFFDVVSKQEGTSSPFTKLSKEKQRCFFTELFKLPEIRAGLVEDFTGGHADIGQALQNESQVFTILGKCGIKASEFTGSG